MKYAIFREYDSRHHWLSKRYRVKWGYVDDSPLGKGFDAGMAWTLRGAHRIIRKNVKGWERVSAIRRSQDLVEVVDADV